MITANQIAMLCGSTVANAEKYTPHLIEEFKRRNIDTDRRVASFLAQISVESGRLTTVEENLNYSAVRLTQVWPNRFPSLAAAKPYANNPRALANKTYGGRYGNTAPDDGWRYRGRGLKQLTFKDNYARASKDGGVDFVNNPDLLLLPQYAVLTAGMYWQWINGNAYADKLDTTGLTKAVNGGLNGLLARKGACDFALAKLGEYKCSWA